MLVYEIGGIFLPHRSIEALLSYKSTILSFIDKYIRHGEDRGYTNIPGPECDCSKCNMPSEDNSRETDDNQQDEGEFALY